MVKKINKKSGQVVEVNSSESAQRASRLGATEDFNPEPQKFSIGNQTFTDKGSFESAKVQAGIGSKGAPAPNAQSTQAAKEFLSPLAQDPNFAAKNPQARSPVGKQLVQEQQAIQQQQTNEFLKTQPGQNELNPSQGLAERFVEGMPVLGLAAPSVGAIGSAITSHDLGGGQKFGAVIEGIPIIGSIVNKYARGIIDTPAGSANDITTEINNQKTIALEYQRLAKASPEAKEIAFDNVEQQELQIQQLENKIKILAASSAELRANPEQLDIMESNILKTKQYLFRVKNNIRLGVDPTLLETPQ